jgi:putative tricarboxylic transport membrane protein
MLDLIVPILSGTTLGFAVGIIPGIGVGALLVLLFPFLLTVDLQSVFVFYCCALSAAQFGGSVVALAVGLPGEQNSLPLIAVREQIAKEGIQSSALFVCAFGHVLGSVIIFAFSWWFIELLSYQTAYLKIYMMVILCVLAILLTMLTSQNAWYTTVAMMIAAVFLSSVGVNRLTGEDFLTFGNIYLAAGFPIMAVLTGFFVVPVIYNMFADREEINVLSIETDLTIVRKLTLIRDCLPSMLRGSVLGFFTGIIPYVGVDLSSYLGFYVERLLKSNTVKQIAAAETATNAAAISVLLPMMLYGIAISVSENLILEIVNTSNRTLNWSTIQPLFPILALSLMITNIISFFLSWNLAGSVVNVLSMYHRYIPYAITPLCCYSVWSLGELHSQGSYYLITAMVFGIFGIFFRNADRLPFLMIFLLHEQAKPAIFRFIQLYL